MSTSYLQTSIKDLYTAYTGRQKNIPATMPNGFRLYTADVQASMIERRRAEIVEEYKSKVVELQKKIASERKQVRLDIGRLRFPGLTNKDATERAIAESQVNSALHFLSTPHSAEAIASTIQDAMDLNRTDFVFTVIDGVRAGIPKDISGQDAPTDAQRVLLTEIAEIENSFDGKAKLDEKRTELANLPALQTIADDFQRQLEAGSQAVILPELAPLLTEEERNAMMLDVEARGNLVDHVSFKRRIGEAMSGNSK